MASALLQAVREGGLVQREGVRSLDITGTLEALSLTTAMVLSQLPAARVEEVARAMAEAMMDDMLRRLREVRAFCDETGLRLFDVDPDASAPRKR
ncbi:hypothetical protein [Sphingomonas jatrophae]|uniref:hypothetical protein n=1 Tax=Sphingomonas jatrophae TaxID=1166337 RepID=UPI0013F4DD4A|nr:hypothetical protein [Sphingomonas jatrophae]